MVMNNGIERIAAERAAVVKAFQELHIAWLSAGHASDMNEEMDRLAALLGLDPLTLELAANYHPNLDGPAEPIGLSMQVDADGHLLAPKKFTCSNCRKKFASVEETLIHKLRCLPKQEAGS